MAFEIVKLDEIDIDIEDIKNRINNIIHKSSPKITLLSEATIRPQQHCAFDKYSKALFLDITSYTLAGRDGYLCCAMVEMEKITFIECTLGRYRDHTEFECKTIYTESEKTIILLKEAQQCLWGNNKNNIIKLSNKVPNNQLTKSRQGDRVGTKNNTYYLLLILFVITFAMTLLKGYFSLMNK